MPVENLDQSVEAAGSAQKDLGTQQAIDASPAAALLAANNADMVNFTCTGWYYKGQDRGEPQEEGCDWMEVLHFQARVAAVGGVT